MVSPLEQPWRLNADIRFACAGGVFFMHSNISALRWQSLAAGPANADHRSVMLLLLRSGKSTTQMSAGFTVGASQNEVLVQDTSVPFTTFTSAHEALLLLLPASLLRAHHLLRQVPVMTWSVHTAPGVLFVSTLEQVFSKLGTMSERELAAAGAGLAGLLDGVMESDPVLLSRQYRDVDRLLSMKRYLRAHLRGPDISIAELCRQFHCSRATLYRVFESEGGVESYINKLRLDCCMQELAKLRQPSHGLIDAMARAWGFTSTASFSSKFYRRFGVRPQEVGFAVEVVATKSERIKGPAGRELERVRSWLNLL